MFVFLHLNSYFEKGELKESSFSDEKGGTGAIGPGWVGRAQICVAEKHQCGQGK